VERSRAGWVVVERTGREGGAGSLVLTKLETKKNRPKAA